MKYWRYNLKKKNNAWPSNILNKIFKLFNQKLRQFNVDKYIHLIRVIGHEIWWLITSKKILQKNSIFQMVCEKFIGSLIYWIKY